MKQFTLSTLSSAECSDLCLRNRAEAQVDLVQKCKEIEVAVRNSGDAALFTFAKQFDGVQLDNLAVTDQEYEACENIDLKLKTAIRQAESNIRLFHEQQKCSSIEVETTSGVRCWREFRPLQSAGLYIPGGSAPLFSTVLMLGIPALLAGVQDIVICTPPNKSGRVAPEILWAAKLLGLRTVYKVGGAQAIFAMAHGTETIPKVDKLFGPGNRFVTTAKQLVSLHTPIDMPAGASEVLVLADQDANPKFVAADLLSQAEHGPDSQAILVTDSTSFIEQVSTEINQQIITLPRKAIAIEALNSSFAMLCENLDEGMEFVNQYAPEHLILHLDDWQSMLPSIKHAGSVFCGQWSPESAGDYASGTNHTLPTSGYARNFSGVSVESFGKYISFQELSKDGLQSLAEIIETMAAAEGLDAHKNAVSLRMQS